MKLRVALLLTAAVAYPAAANDCAAPTSRINNLNASGILNTYYPVLPVGTGVSNGVAAFAVGPAITCAGCPADDIKTGDMLMLIQFQEPSIVTAPPPADPNTANYGGNDGTGRGTITASSNSFGMSRFTFLRVNNTNGTYPGSPGNPAIGTTVATAASGGTISTTNGATGAGADFSFGSGTAQGRLRGGMIIRIPQLANVRLTGTLTAPPLQNGTLANGQLQQGGGIVVLDVAATLDFNGNSIDVSGRGFRGGGGRQLTGGGTTPGASTDYVRLSTQTNAHGMKGEGISGTPRYVNNNGTVIDNGTSLATADGIQNGALGRGAPGNAGGGGTDALPASNSGNTGGGGGAGYGNGGNGGNFGGAGNGGIGGAAFTEAFPILRNANSTLGRVQDIWNMAVMGGGGGAGSANTAGASAASGAAGGGIVIIRAHSITGTGTILANGANAGVGPTGDAAGGGGGGGWVVIAAADQTRVTAPNISIQARGGNGGSLSDNGNNSGVGGGGGGGAASVTTNLSGNVSASTLGGSAGTIAPASTSTGATNGDNGPALRTFNSIYNISVGPVSGLTRSISSGAECVPQIWKTYTPYVAASGANRTFQVNIRNENAGGIPRQLTNLQLVDTYPAGVVNASVPNLSNNGNCGSANGAATPAGNQFQVTGTTIAGGTTCTYTMTVTATGTGILTNTIPKDSVPGDIGPVGSVITSPNAADATASLTFPSTVTATKSSTVISDPVSNTTNPKRIPGATVDYTINVTNATGSVLDAGTMVISDALPAQTKIFVNNLPSQSAAYEFTANASNLTCTGGCFGYSTMANPSVSNDAHWTYTPTPDGSGADPAVTHIRFKTTGSMAVGSSIAFRYRTIVR